MALDETQDSVRGLSRRIFLYGSAAGALIALHPSLMAFASPEPGTDLDWLKFEKLAFDDPLDDLLSVTRAEDFVAIHIGLINAKVRTALDERDSTNAFARDVARIVRCGPGPVSVVLIFGPQHVAERAYLLENSKGSQSIPLVERGFTIGADAKPESAADSAESIISGSSRLAFSLPERELSNDHAYGIPLAFDQILMACASARLELPKLQPESDAKNIPRSQTLIEFPTRLFITPSTPEVHLDPKVNDGKPAERDLSKFGSLIKNASPNRRSVLWGIDLAHYGSRRLIGVSQRSDTTDDLYADSQVLLHESLRGFLIKSTTSRQGTFTANLLQLTSLGINADVIFVRRPGAGNPFVSWHQTTTNGRDAHVELVFDGVIMPFGHRAELVLTTKRTPYEIDEEWYGLLIETTTIRLVDRNLGLDASAPGYQPSAERAKLRALTPRRAAATAVSLEPHVSPPIKLPRKGDVVDKIDGDTLVPGTDFLRTFVPTGLDGKPIKWRLTPKSHAGEAPECEPPQVFVFNDGSLCTPDDSKALAAAINTYYATVPGSEPYREGPVTTGAIVAKDAIDSDNPGTPLPLGTRFYRATRDDSLPPALITAIESGLLVAYPSVGDLNFFGQPYTFTEAASIISQSENQAKNFLRTLSMRYIVDIDYDFENKVFDVLPTLVFATVVLPASQAIGAVDDAANAVTLRLLHDYSSNAEMDFERIASSTGIYASIEDAVLDFNRDRSVMQSGLASMRAQLGALSRSYGAILGNATDAKNLLRDAATLSLQKVMKGAADVAIEDAKLFGVVALSDLLKDTGSFLDPGFPRLPIVRRADGTIEVDYTFDQSLTVRRGDVIKPFPPTGHDEGGSIALSYNAHASISPNGRSERSVRVVLGGVTVPMPPKFKEIPKLFQGLIDLNFNGVTFSMIDGAMSVTPSFSGVEIKTGKAIAFLAQFGPLFGGGNPFSISLDGVDIAAIGSFVVPDIDLGGFTLENLNLRLEAILPLNADYSPRISFDIANRLNPFTALLDFLGGGGWFHLSFAIANLIPTASNGNKRATPDLEIAGGLNVSAGLAIDLGGIVKGWVSADAGVFFELSEADESPSLTFGGDVVLSGGVEAFDLISASMYVAIEVEYDSGSSCLSGSAEYHIEVHILFFGASFTASVEFHEPLGQSRCSAPLERFATSIGTAWDDHLARRRIFA